MFEKKKLSFCVAAIAWGLAAAMPLAAQESGEERKPASAEERSQSNDTSGVKETRVKRTGEDPNELIVSVPETGIETIEVTGSLIPRTGFDGPDPITVIDADDMKKMGLNTVSDVIDTLTANSGYSEGKSGALTTGFTTGASEANLRGLGVGRTLVLINGRRIADYPMPFGGEQNGADLGTIPFSALSRVEVLSGSASATYGSDAVGGVINLITNRDMERTSLSVNTGAYEEGYGFFNQMSFTTGAVFDRGSVTLSLENVRSEPVAADQVSFLDSNELPYTGIRAQQRDLGNAAGNGFVSPMGFSCDDRGMSASESANADGATVCNYDLREGIALQNELDRSSLFLDGRYQLTDTITGFATVLASKQAVSTKRNATGWSNFQITNDDLDKIIRVDRSFVPDLGFVTTNYDQEMWTLMAGLQGEFALGDNAWNWDLGYSKARFKVQQSSPQLREEVLEELLLEGASSYTKYGIGQYRVDNNFFENGLVDNIFRDMSLERDALVGTATIDAASGAQTLNAKVVGELGDLGGWLYNPVTMAVLAEWSHQDTGISPDERYLNDSGLSWFRQSSVVSAGDRSRKAIAAEFLVPVVEDLEVTLATRFDRYDDSTAIGGRNTSTAKFAYRPIDTMMFRGHFAQSFRAPDMFAIYGESGGNTDVVDLSAAGCYDDGNISGCPLTSVNFIRQGRTDLDEEKGDDVGFGIVLTPTNNVSASLDWYRVKMENLVALQLPQYLMEYEYGCNNGEYSIGSRFCQDVFNRVVRDEFGQLETVITSPANEAYREVEGIDAEVRATFESQQYGNFGVTLNYTNTLAHDWQKFAGDEALDVRKGEIGRSTPATSTNLVLSWANPLSAFQSVGGALFIRRQGSVDNYAHTKELEPYYTADLIARYQVDARLNIGLTVKNLTNAMPVEDETYSWPNYWQHLQTPLGRSYTLSVNYFLSD
ncbi:TonB-dependent receptor [uncultured Microbulbifer sp.]|uniref:TonB-dependent receptor domain-containing protein n=1 Tax=uncultured Microbulbifer sp. TaxID=348147 RepID=UPI00261A2B10|nr:TonB-dependent receptor [uncultured Microbulbifer sp.]